MSTGVELYHIIEVANTHGGSFEYIMELVKEFSEFPKSSFGIKFQPLRANALALPDYEWYSVYEDLYFDMKQWEKIFTLASKTKEIWIDIFDVYGVEVLTRHFSLVIGIKLQASVLLNQEVKRKLKQLDFSNKIIMLNISGFSLEDIRSVVKTYKSEFMGAEIVLQIGFQGYPTVLEDSGLSKIPSVLAMGNRVAFADHIAGELEDSLILPMVASVMGATIVEKHVKHSTRETKYDHYSAIDVTKFQSYVDLALRYSSLIQKPFIAPAEREYLRKSDQIPVLSRDVNAGEILSWEDFSFRRTGRGGMSARQLQAYIGKGFIVNAPLKQHSTLTKGALRLPVTATIIAVRLKSSRLKGKALLPIGDLTSIEYCIRSALKFGTHHTVVATSTVKEDEPLKDYTYSPAVLFRRGDPVDVIKRYLDICNELKVDILARVTGDCPLISHETYSVVMKSHLRGGFDYSVAKEAATGTNIEIINVEALRRVQQYFPEAQYSEYMTWYFQNNPEVFRINFVELPPDLVRDYRLTLDYEEDLLMFNKLEEHLAQDNKRGIRDVFKILDSHPEIAKLNEKCVLTYKTDQKLIDLLNRETKIVLK